MPKKIHFGLFILATLIFGSLSTNLVHAANPAFVKLVQASATANTNTVSSGNFSSAVTNGNAIVVWLWYNSSTQSVSSITDTKGNIYAKAVGPTTGTGGLASWRQEIWYAKNVVGGTSLNVTATFTGTFGTEKAITAHEYSGVDQTSPLDATAAAAVSTSNSSSGLATTHFSNELIFGAAVFQGNGTAGSGFTQRSNLASNATEDKIAATAGSYAATFTNTSQPVIVQMAAFKAASTIADTQAPSTPTNLAAVTISQSQINLSWTASTDNVGVTGYKVFRNGSQIATSTVASFNNTGLAPGTTYTYAVSAFDASNNVSSTSLSVIASTTAPDTQAPTVPTNLQASNVSATFATISWTASTDNIGVAGYQIFRNGAQIGTSTATTSFNDPGLTASTTYTYKVTAYDAVGNISAQSSPLIVTTTAGPYQYAYPVKVGPNGRYLVDQNNVPFLMVGDSPQSSIGDLSEAQADAFFADREAHGFNTVWINLICDDYTFCNSDGTTFDGIRPFTGTSPANYDLSLPNEVFFTRADHILQSAINHHLNIILDPIETGGWLTTMKNNGQTKDFNYGVYLGNRYKNYPNIIWMSGNDFGTYGTPGDDAVVMAVANGIKSVDTNHIHTLEISFGSNTSLDDPNWAPIVKLNAAYSYYPTYDMVLHAYNQSATTPTFMVEAHYEFETVGGCCSETGVPKILRQQEYWTQLSGATGQLYGSLYTDRVANGWLPSDVDSIGVTELGYMKNLFAPRAWYNLVPDQNHTVLVAGYGAYNGNGAFAGNNYVTVASTADGTLVMAYTPNTATLTIDMTKLVGPVTARWFDPTNNTFQTVSGSFPNIGTRQFVSPGTNSSGDQDWILVLEASIVPDTQAPTVPSNLAAVPASASQINLSWTASTDDRLVSGYDVYRNGTKVGTTSAVSYSDIGLTSSTAYSYTVDAFDTAANTSAKTSPVVATTSAVDTQAPTVPTGLQASNITSNSLTLSWTPSTDNLAVSGYQVFRNGSFIATSSSASYNDSLLNASTTYTYTVTAFDASLNISAQSAPLQVSTTQALNFATPTFVQLTENDANTNSSSISTASTFSTAGNTLVIWLWYNSSTASVTSMTDSFGDTFTKAIGSTRGTGNLSGWSQEIWYAKNVHGGSSAITANFSATFSGEKAISVHEYSGLDKANPLDVASGVAGSTANAATPAMSTSQSSEMIFGTNLFLNSGTAGAGFNQRSSLASNATEDKNVTITGSYSAIFNNASQNWIADMAIFKAASI